jgi:hypothetical protein
LLDGLAAAVTDSILASRVRSSVFSSRRRDSSRSTRAPPADVGLELSFAFSSFLHPINKLVVTMPSTTKICHFTLYRPFTLTLNNTLVALAIAVKIRPEKLQCRPHFNRSDPQDAIVF